MLVTQLERRYGSRICRVDFFRKEKSLDDPDRNPYEWAQVSVYDTLYLRLPLMYSYVVDWAKAHKALNLFERTGNCTKEAVFE